MEMGNNLEKKISYQVQQDHFLRMRVEEVSITRNALGDCQKHISPCVGEVGGGGGSQIDP